MHTSKRPFLKKTRKDFRIRKVASSAGNIQPSYFLVVKSSEKREKLAKGGRYARFLAESPIVIVGCGDQEASPNWYAVARAGRGYDGR